MFIVLLTLGCTTSPGWTFTPYWESAVVTVDHTQVELVWQEGESEEASAATPEEVDS